MLHDYKLVAYGADNAAARQSIIDHLDVTLPDIWADDYRTMTRSPTNLLTVSFGDEKRVEHFVSYLFDHTSGHADLRGTTPEQLRKHTDDRVVGVWGLSRYEPGSTRDRSRMKGYLQGVWSDAYGGMDRGHFFAHTMGGGLDINLFPQVSAINQRGLWRELESYCADNPGTFCFVHPIYRDRSWRPTQLEYGIYKLPPRQALDFRGHLFGN
jgi:hypothetical protein